MAKDITKRLISIVLLVLIQALVLNHIHLFNCATPMLYLLIPLKFSSEQTRWSSLLWCFGIGLLIDILSNTPGIAAASMTFIGLLQPYLLSLFISNDKDEVIRPSIKSLGWLKFLTYSLIIILVYCLVFFTLEAFSFFDMTQWALSIGASTLFTLILVTVMAKL